MASEAERLRRLAEQHAAERADQRIFTVPNVISLLRLAVLMPLFVVVLLVWKSPGWALIIAIILGLTDYLDGFIARRFHQVTALGRALDPIADRVSQILVAAALVVGGYIPVWMAVAVLVFDLALGIVLLFRGRRPIPVRWIGRIRTALLLVGMPFVLLIAAIAPHNALLNFIAVSLVGVAVILNSIADLIYIWSLFKGTANQVQDAHPVVD